MTAQERLNRLHRRKGQDQQWEGRGINEGHAELTTDIAVRFSEWKQKEVCTGYQGRYFLFDSGEKGDRWANDKELFEYFILNVYNK